MGHNTIGGTAAGTGNLISGNTSYGIQILAAAATGNLVAGNLIGTDVTGTAAIANGNGMLIESASNTIGGSRRRRARRGQPDLGQRSDRCLSTEFRRVGQRGRRQPDRHRRLRCCFRCPTISAFTSSAAGNTIGGTAAGAGNLISGNTIGAWRSTGRRHRTTSSRAT